MGVYRRKKQGPDPLVRGTDPTIRIRIRTNMSRIRNTGVMDPAPHSLAWIRVRIGLGMRIRIQEHEN
jgi:hypothetical protein